MDGGVVRQQGGSAEDPVIEIAQAPGAGESIGRVEATKGNTFITRTDGTKIKAATGVEIFQGDTVETDADGSIGIVFADNTTFSLDEDGEMVIDEMVYDPGSQEGTALFQVASGVFTFASGQIAKTGVDNMQITTPTATIGIRGTSGAVRIGTDGPDTYTLLSDAQARSEAGIQGQAADDVPLAQVPGAPPFGGMTVANNVGVQILNQINQTTQVATPFSSPTLPIILPDFAVSQTFGSAQAILPPPVFLAPSPTGGAPGGGPAPGQAEQQTETGATAQPGATDPGAELVGAADSVAAAGDAFKAVLAGGGTLEDAMVAAADAAAQTTIQNALSVDPNVFGTAGSIDSSMGGIIGDALGDVGFDAGDPLDPGTGDGGAVQNSRDDFADVVAEISEDVIKDSVDKGKQAITGIIADLVSDGSGSPDILGAFLAAADNLGQTNFAADLENDLADPLAGTLDAVSDQLGSIEDALGGGSVTEAANIFEDQAQLGEFGGALPGDPNEFFGDNIIELPDDFFDTGPPDEDEDLPPPPVDETPTGTTSVTTFLGTGSDSYDFVNEQNDILISTQNSSDFNLTVGDQAEDGDILRGAAANDIVNFASSSENLNHTFAIEDVEQITLPSIGFDGGTPRTFNLNIRSSGFTTIAISTPGTNIIDGTAEDRITSLDQNWLFTRAADSDSNFLSLIGGAGNDSVTFNTTGTDSIAAMTEIEYFSINTGNVILDTFVDGVTFSVTAGGTLNLGSAAASDSALSGNSVTLGQGGGHTGSVAWTSLVGGTGDDTVTIQASGQPTSVSNTNGGDGTNDSLTVSGVNAQATAFNVSNFETLTGTTSGSGTTRVSLAAGGQTLTAGGTFDSFAGGSGADQVTLAASGTNTFDNVSNGGSTLTFVDGGATNDSVTIGSSGGTFSLQGAIETVVGSGTDDTINLTGSTSNSIGNVSAVETITGTVSTNDTVTFGSSASTTSLDGIENVTGGSANEVLTLSSATSDFTADLGGGTGDEVTLASGVNTGVTISNAEIITGGSSDDTVTINGTSSADITGGAGKDTFNLDSTGAHTLIYASASHGDDTYTGFAAGTGSDVVHFSIGVSLNNGTDQAALVEITSTSAQLDANSVFFALGGASFTATDTDTAAGAASVINGLDTSNIVSGDSVMIAMDNGTNSYLWYFTEDGSAGAETNDLQLIATFSGIADAASFDDGDLTKTGGLD